MIIRYITLAALLSFKSFVYGQSFHFESLTVANGLSNSVVYAIGQDKYGFIWIGTKNGLNIYDGISFKQYYPSSSDESSLPGNCITDMVFEKDSVWIATRSGLCKMDIRTKGCKRYLLGENNELRTLFLEKKNKVLWIGTTTGLVRLNTVTGEFRVFNTQNSNISSNIVRSIYKDRNDNLWLGTFDKLNLLRANAEVFEQINLKRRQSTKIKNNLVLSICPISNTNDSLLWVGTETGLVLYNRFSKTMDFYQPPHPATGEAAAGHQHGHPCADH